MAEQTKTVAVGMSGGVDSTFAAHLLVEQGYEVIGVTALMAPDRSRCCSDEDVEMAGKVARALGFPYHIIDLRSEFKDLIITYFGDEYVAGRTPSPCVLCNREIKFGLLADQARKLGAEAMATGHYAIVRGDSREGFAVSRGVDRSKDQSYFLAMLSQEQLAGAVLPLGAMLKNEVTRRSSGLNIPSRPSRESQELCFIPEGHHGTWLDVRRLDAPGPGRIVDADGRIIGEHMGIHHYTIGQRKGLGVSVGYPAYVVDIDVGSNTITVGPRESVMGSRLRVNGLNWMRQGPPDETFEATVQIRYNHAGSNAAVRLHDKDSAEVVFNEPQFAITAGQLCVFYDGDEVIGSGWIA